MKNTITEIKKSQGFERKAPICNNCKHFTCDKITERGYTYSKNLRCSLGGFAVKVTNWCRCHERTEENKG